jgi:hypothetical protein
VLVLKGNMNVAHPLLYKYRTVVHYPFVTLPFKINLPNARDATVEQQPTFNALVTPCRRDARAAHQPPHTPR